jgi:hypothetical protein
LFCFSVAHDLELTALTYEGCEFPADSALLGSSWPEVLSKANDYVLKAQQVTQDAISSSFQFLQSAAVDDAGVSLLPLMITATGDCPVATFSSLLADEGFVSFAAAVGRLVASGALGKPPTLPSLLAKSVESVSVSPSKPVSKGFSSTFLLLVAVIDGF